jgi:hypothetical protein
MTSAQSSVSAEPPPPPRISENPWRGLDYYREEDRDLFFGRKHETAQLLRLIQREALTIFFGRSGSGKTSLLRAGVIPELRELAYFPVALRFDWSEPGLHLWTR